MIELQMVKRMIIKGAAIAPLLVTALWVWNGSEYALSGAIGLGMTVLNLWLAAKVIGSVAERNPKLLMAAGMAAFAFGLALLTLIAIALKATDVVYFPVTGFTLVGSHLLLVTWEAVLAFKIGQNKSPLRAQKT
ncbi:MAG: hypothetical protein ACRD1T_06325 [Acidimicrobiia bacterium]